MKRLESELERFQHDIDHFNQRYDELLQKYPDQWVAVYDERVVGNNADARQLLEALTEQGVPIEKTVVRYLNTKDEVLILP